MKLKKVILFYNFIEIQIKIRIFTVKILKKRKKFALRYP